MLGVYEICLQSENKKMLITLHFTLTLNVTMFHVCTDYLNH